MSGDVRDFMSSSSSGEWSLVDVHQKSDDTQSDIEVISNPSTEHDVMEFPEELQPKLLYSEILMKEKPVIESDIEFVPEPDSQELEFDDEEYLNEVLQSTQLSSDESGGESEDDMGESTRTITKEEPDNKEVVLEVNLTLLSFSIIIGVSGMSGFLLGGIYSAVLTNNIEANTDLAQYPGTLPSYLYRESDTCPNGECEYRLYRVEENMKHLKETMSHQIQDCYSKLRKAAQHNEALHKINNETADYASNACAVSRAEINELQSKSSSLLTELAKQKQKLSSYKEHSRAHSAQTAVQMDSMRRNLESTVADLHEARKALSVLDGMNRECNKRDILSSFTSHRAIGAVKRHSEESGVWKKLYMDAISDLEEAEKKVDELEKCLKEEMDDLREIQVAESNMRIAMVKERQSKQYYKGLSERYEELLQAMERRYLKVRSKQHQLGAEFEDLKLLSDEMEYNLESCSNATVRAEQRAQNALKSKQYVEYLLISKVSSNKELYRSMKKMYEDQEKIVAGLESQRSALEETLIRKISGNRKKLLSAKSHVQDTLASLGSSKQDASIKFDVLKSKVGRSRSEKNIVKSELEKSRNVITDFQNQMYMFGNYTKQIEAHLDKLREEAAIREAIQGKQNLATHQQHQSQITELHSRYSSIINATYIDLYDRLSETNWKLGNSSNLLMSKSVTFNSLRKKYNHLVRDFNMEKNSKKQWKKLARFNEDQVERLSTELEVRLNKLYEDSAVRDIMQHKYNQVRDQHHQSEISALHTRYNSILTATYTDLHYKLSQSKLELEKSSKLLTSRSTTFDKLKKKHDNLVRDIKEEQSSKKWWKDAAHFNKHQYEKTSDELSSCKSGTVTAVAEYKKTNELLLKLIKNVASKPKVLQIMRNSTGETYNLLREIYSDNTSSSHTSSLELELESCYSSLAPLFPGAKPETLANVINITKTPSSAGKKMSTALSKYWHDVDKTYNKLCKIRKHELDDDDDDDEDWYFKRFQSSDPRVKYPHGHSRFEAKPKYVRGPSHDWFMDGRNRKGEYSHVNKKNDMYKKDRRHKGDLDCNFFDCGSPFSASFGIELCGC